MNTENDKLRSALGLCRRAGKLGMGFDATVSAIVGHHTALVLFASDISPKTEKECRFAAVQHPVQMITLPFDKETLSACIGMSKPIGVVAVLDSGLAKMVRQACPTDKEE